MGSFSGKKLFINKRKRVFKQILIGVSLFLVGSGLANFLYLFSGRLFPSSWVSHPLFLILIVTLVFITAYKPLDFLFSEIFKRYFFRKRSYVHMMLMNLAEELELVLDLQEIGNLTVNTFAELLHLKTTALLVVDSEEECFQMVAAHGWNVSDYRRVKLPVDAPMIACVRHYGAHVLVRNQAVRALDWREANKLAEDFDRIQASWIIPLIIKDKLIGLLAFSSVDSEKTFDETDFQFFRRFSQAIAKRVHIALSFQDLRKANETLQDTQSRLIQMTKLTAIEQLASGIAHQIHNPLTIISGKAQVLLLQQDRVPLDERVQEVLKTIVKQTKRAADITKKLLVFTQGSKIHKEPLALDQIVEDTLALISYQTSLEGIELTRSVDPHLPTVSANVHEMREVFFNLILNAVQSVEKGGKIHLSIDYKEEEGNIEIQILDSGKGIPKENIDKLFNPFFTTRQEALGLGLFVTKQIIHRLGGLIRVESRVGEGSLFIVRIPVADRNAGAGPQKEKTLAYDSEPSEIGEF